MLKKANSDWEAVLLEGIEVPQMVLAFIGARL
jgi:hypothetical protein